MILYMLPDVKKKDKVLHFKIIEIKKDTPTKVSLSTFIFLFSTSYLFSFFIHDL